MREPSPQGGALRHERGGGPPGESEGASHEVAGERFDGLAKDASSGNGEREPSAGAYAVEVEGRSDGALVALDVNELEAKSFAATALEGLKLEEHALEASALEGRSPERESPERSAPEESAPEGNALEGRSPEGESLEAASGAQGREVPGWCSLCDRPLWSGARFCGACGTRVGREPASAAGSRTMDDVRMLLGFFLSAMAIAVVWSVWFRVTEDAFVSELGAGVSLAALTVGYGVWHRDLLAGALRTAGFSVGGYALVAAVSVPGVLLVSAYVDSLHGVLGLQMESELAGFAGRSVLWPLLMVVVLPPLSEEVAFRGILYGGLRRSLSVGEAMFLSSFAFAMLHLSVMSLFTHLPLGAYFCWLRQRSGSVWPGVFAHACHNLGVCLLTWW